MDWTQALTVIGVFIGGFIYMMSKMDSNKKDTDQKIDTCRKEIEQKIESYQKETNARFNTIENRLTAMEVEVKNINQRLSTIENYLLPRKVFRFDESHHDYEELKEN